MVDARANIVHVLFETDTPMNLYQISKKSQIGISTLDYWVDKMVKEGVVVSDDSGEQRRYILQPLFYDSKFTKQFDATFNRLYSLVREKIVVPPNLSNTDKKRITFAILLSILHHLDMHVEE